MNLQFLIFHNFPKSFDPDKDAKVELLCGMIKISLGKLEKPITKKFKIKY